MLYRVLILPIDVSVPTEVAEQILLSAAQLPKPEGCPNAEQNWVIEKQPDGYGGSMFGWEFMTELEKLLGEQDG